MRKVLNGSLFRVLANFRVVLHVNNFPSAIKIWNNLPESVIQARNVEDFKRMIRIYYS